MVSLFLFQFYIKFNILSNISQLLLISPIFNKFHKLVIIARIYCIYEKWIDAETHNTNYLSEIYKRILVTFLQLKSKHMGYVVKSLINIWNTGCVVYMSFKWLFYTLYIGSKIQFQCQIFKIIYQPIIKWSSIFQIKYYSFLHWAKI